MKEWVKHGLKGSVITVIVIFLLLLVTTFLATFGSISRDSLIANAVMSLLVGIIIFALNWISYKKKKK